MGPDQAMAGAMQIRQAMINGEIDQGTAQQYMGAASGDDEARQQRAELDVDIDIDEVNETPTLQIEQFEQLTQLVSSGVLGRRRRPK
jgi:hypothetical protein